MRNELRRYGLFCTLAYGALSPPNSWGADVSESQSRAHSKATSSQALRVLSAILRSGEDGAATSLSIRAQNGCVPAGVPFVIAADIVASGVVSTGVVNFNDGGTGFCSAPVQNGVAACEMISSFGDNTLVAVFPGGNGFQRSEDLLSLCVRNRQFIDFDLPGSGATYNYSSSLSIGVDATSRPVADPLSSTSTGLPVNFSSDTPDVCTASGTNIGAIQVLRAGSCVVRATASGDATYAPASAALTITIRPGAQNVTLNCPPSGSPIGPGTTFNCAGSQSTSGDVVAITAGPVGACSASGSVVTYQSGTGQECVITGTVAAGDRYGPATASFTLAAGAAPQQIVWRTDPPAVRYRPGDTFSIVIEQQGASGNPVVFTRSPESAAVCEMVSSLVVRKLSVGVCNLEGTQAAGTAGGVAYSLGRTELRPVQIVKADQCIVQGDAPGAQYFGPNRVFEPDAISVVRGDNDACLDTPTGLEVRFSVSDGAQTCGAIGGRQIRIKQDQGSCTLVATQAGNAFFNAVVEESQFLTNEVPVNRSTTATGKGTSAELPSEQAASDSAGRFLVYTVGGPTGAVWRLDSRTGRKERIDVDANNKGIGSAGEPTLSGNGGIVLFSAPNALVGKLHGESKANADARRAKGGLGVFLRNAQTGTLRPLQPVSSGSGSAPRISPDGQMVVYVGSNTITGGKPALISRTISIAANGDAVLGAETCQTCVPANPETPQFEAPVLSGNGQWIAFASDAKNLLAGGTACPQANNQLFLRNILTGTTRQIGTPAAASCTAGTISKPSIDQSGRLVALQSTIPLVAGVTPGESHVYVHDTLTNLTRRVSTEPVADTAPSLAGDGRSIAFVRADGALQLAGLDNAGAVIDESRRNLAPPDVGQLGAGVIRRPVLDRYGQKLMFDSDGGNAVTGAPSGERRVFQMSVPQVGFETNFQRVFDSGFE